MSAWRPDPRIAWEEVEQLEEEEEEEVTLAIADAVSREVVDRAFRPAPDEIAPPATDVVAPAVRPQRSPLPDLHLVTETVVSGADWAPSARDLNSSRGSSSNWTPRSPDEQLEDRELGRRGEEIVVRRERERVAALGFTSDRVVWTADIDPGADHDIESVDADGHDVWIEVKSTTGKDGRFTWARAEFQRAVRERERYVLYRVYEAQTLTPVIREITDPVGRVESGGLRLDLDSFLGDVGSLRR